MEARIGQYDNRRHGGNISSWRLFLRERMLGVNPTLDGSVVEAYEHYGRLVAVSKERLERPADDSFRLTKKGHSTDVLLFGRRGSSKDGRFSESDARACQDFLDESSQFFGDEYAYSAASQLVFLPPVPSEGAMDGRKSEVDWKGFMTFAAPSVIFINSKAGLEYDSLVDILRHEFAHKLHGLDISDQSNLLSSLGWRVDEMNRSQAEWSDGVNGLGSEYFAGSSVEFSEAAKNQPCETIAEAYSQYMNNAKSFSYDEVARDAMIDFLSSKAKGPLATSVDWRPARIRGRRL